MILEKDNSSDIKNIYDNNISNKKNSNKEQLITLEEFLDNKNSAKIFEEIIIKYKLEYIISDSERTVDLGWKCAIEIKEPKKYFYGFGGSKKEAKSTIYFKSLENVCNKCISFFIYEYEYKDEIIKYFYFDQLTQHKHKENKFINQKRLRNDDQVLEKQQNIICNPEVIKESSINIFPRNITFKHIENNMNIPKIKNLSRKEQLNFEIYCHKWERCFLVETDHKQIDKIVRTITKKLIKVNKNVNIKRLIK